MARAWHLTSRPNGLPQDSDFALVESEDAALAEGQFRVSNSWLSVDPYMRGRMNEVAGYAASYELDQPMTGGSVGTVVESRNPDFAEGDTVSHMGGWRDSVVLGEGVEPPAGMPPMKLPDLGVPDEHWLSIMGMPGGTAWFGLMKVADAKPGEVVFVSAAAGAVGSTVVQIAKAKGMTVIGSAGGKAKCDWVRSIGADACIDYKDGPVLGQLVEAVKSVGDTAIDVYFDNVGSDHLDAALALSREWARFAICGMIDTYNSQDPQTLRFLLKVIAARVRIQGFLYPDFIADVPAFQKEMADLIKAGKVESRETVKPGLESAIEAFQGLFSGENTGKMLIKL